MKVIKVRSPFIVSVNEFGQVGSKVELYIYNKGMSEPTTPTYSLIKSIASNTQIKNSYNISNYISEFIKHNPTDAYVFQPEQESNDTWAICKVKRYKLIAGAVAYQLLDTIEYIAVNGFTNYENGLQVAQDRTSEASSLVLSNQNGVLIQDTGEGYVNLIFQKTNGINFIAVYLNENGTTNSSANINTGSSANGTYFNFKIPFRGEFVGSELQTLQIKSTTNILRFTKKTTTVLECKYVPVICSFVNRFGGWEFITFFKQQTNSISVKSEDYKLAELNSPSLIKTFNVNGRQSIKLNTGFVPENYSEIITDLMLSEDIYLDKKPVTIKTQTSELKNSLKDKLINYEIDFEFAYNLINDAI